MIFRPYEAHFIFFPDSAFSVLIFLNSVFYGLSVVCNQKVSNHMVDEYSFNISIRKYYKFNEYHEFVTHHCTFFF